MLDLKLVPRLHFQRGQDGVCFRSRTPKTKILVSKMASRLRSILVTAHDIAGSGVQEARLFLEP